MGVITTGVEEALEGSLSLIIAVVVLVLSTMISGREIRSSKKREVVSEAETVAGLSI